MSALDQQVDGSYYREMAIQPVQYIMANNLGFCESNVVKYVSRWKAKNGVRDLLKAKHYIDLLIEFAGKDTKTPDMFKPTSVDHYTSMFEKAAAYRAEEEKARKASEAEEKVRRDVETHHRNVLAGAYAARFPRVDPATIFGPEQKPSTASEIAEQQRDLEVAGIALARAHLAADVKKDTADWLSEQYSPDQKATWEQPR